MNDSTADANPITTHDSQQQQWSNGGNPIPSFSSSSPSTRKPIKPRFAVLPPLKPLAIQRKQQQGWRDECGPDVSSSSSSSSLSSQSQVQAGRLDPVSARLAPDRAKRAFFDKECSLVAEHIYLGSESVAKNREVLRSHGITHVLNCVGFVCPEYFKAELVYKTLWLRDSPSEDITSLLYDVFDYLEEVRKQGGRVFVHCCQGVSRSNSLVIAYVMWREGRSFEGALAHVRSARGVTNPNMGFAFQLLQSQHRVQPSIDSTSPADPVPCTMYRLAPHSPYDPLHLVPKQVESPPCVDALDSRGAFVVRSPHVIYVWMGLDCPLNTGQAARGAADQVRRYERVDGPILICKEGHESADFWHALSALDPPAEGIKRVPSYDADFELYGIASWGGIFPPIPWSGVGSSSYPTRVPARDDGWCRFRRKLPWVVGLIAAVKLVVKTARADALGQGEFQPLHAYEDLSKDLGSPDFVLPSLSPSSASSSLPAPPISASTLS